MAFEYKLLISHKSREILQQKIEPFVQPSKQMAKNPLGILTVRSIYMDTPAFDFYNFKIDNLVVRKNVRISGHNGDMTKAFLEVSRSNENLFYKSKASVPYDRVNKLFKGEIQSNEFLWDIKKSETASRFFYQIHRYNLRPTLKIVHDRAIFSSKIMDKENDFKIIFQNNLRCSPFPTVDTLFEENNMTSVMQDRILMVVRYERACPAWFKSMLSDMIPVSGRTSKYRVCMEAMPYIRTKSRLDNIIRGRIFQPNSAF
jgi:hypothetical protein